MKNQTFSEKLVNWYAERKRDLPWRNTKDPYKVWLSEIILQQTRVDQGLPYYEKFVDAFPTIRDLANTGEGQVLRLWQGLGYYSRARNLHATAKTICEELDGIFPTTYKELLKLKGIGPYTAAAIASICFDEPSPVVDGNVFRFASRYFGIQQDISKASTRKIFEDVLTDVISKENPGAFNQAMMEFGSTTCTPTTNCSDCIFNLECFAKQRGLVGKLPTKKGKTKVQERRLHYLVINSGSTFLMKQRDKKDVWMHLFDFPSLEGKHEIDDILTFVQEKLGHRDFLLKEVSDPITHLLSHQRIIATFYNIEVPSSVIRKVNLRLEAQPFSTEEIVNLPKPKLIVNYLQQIGIKS